MREPLTIAVRPAFSGFASSNFIGVPADNGPANGGGFVDTFPLFTAPKNHFVQLVLTGTVTASNSGNCSPPVGQTGTWDADGYNGNELRVNVVTSPNISPNRGGTGTITINKGTSGSDVLFSVFRKWISGDCNGGQTAGLNLSGGQDIEWEVYPFFEVTASDAVFSSGDSVTFDASDSHWTTTSNFWKWRNNDTTATPGGHGFGSLQVCGSSETCTYAPSAPGRMYRVGTFPAPDGSQYAAASPIVWKDSARQFTLQMTTNDSSRTRGDSVDFVVRNAGAGGELNAVELAWRFEPDLISYYPTMPPTFPPDEVYDTLPAGDTIWSGPIVHPGKVIVSGVSVDSAFSHEDTIIVTVADRDWDPPPMTLVEQYFNTDQPEIPEDTATIFEGARFHTVPPTDETFDGGPSLDIVDGGPNKGYHYVVSTTYEMRRAYSLNDWISDPGPLYDGGLTTWQFVDDAGFDPSNFLNNAIAHEVGGSTSSHRGRQVVAAASFPSCGHFNRAVERLVTSSGEVRANRIDLARIRAEDAVWYLSSHIFVNGFQGSPNHVAEWRAGLRPGVKDSLQDLTSSNAPKPDTLFCDISGI